MKDGSVLGIIQARMSSERLPGKVMRQVLGKPLLAYLIERIMPSRMVDAWIIATSAESSDDPIASYCASTGVACFRGSLTDVLDRYYQCACAYQPKVVVRVTADCPLHHFEVVEFAMRTFWESGADYVTNSFPPSFEDGFDTEVFRFECLEQAWHTANTPYAREHVTPVIRQDVRLRRTFQQFLPGYAYKLSVDTAEDFGIVSRLIEILYPQVPLFTMADVVKLIQANPRWAVARVGPQAGVSA